MSTIKEIISGDLGFRACAVRPEFERHVRSQCEHHWSMHSHSCRIAYVCDYQAVTIGRQGTLPGLRSEGLHQYVVRLGLATSLNRAQVRGHCLLDPSLCTAFKRLCSGSGGSPLATNFQFCSWTMAPCVPSSTRPSRRTCLEAKVHHMCQVDITHH